MPHATLHVNLSAIRRNWRLLASKLNGGSCAAVVKANAYGLGAVPVTQALLEEGCEQFFVATLEEGLELRQSLGNRFGLYVFSGSAAGEERDFTAHSLRPVHNTVEQLIRWKENTAGAPSALHIDTGMNRLGITPAEALSLSTKQELLAAAGVQLLLSHLACANEPSHPMNAQQLSLAQSLSDQFPGMAMSLCNSSGIFLGRDYHFQLARPGCSLYGIAPQTTADNPMENTVRLEAPVLQLRVIDRAGTVGYGATREVPVGSRIATLGMGYADGYHRSLSGKGFGSLGGVRVPVLGRVSMDMISVDVSQVPETQLSGAVKVELIGSNVPVDTVAELAGTIGYEIFTGLGSRVKRIYEVV